MGTRLTAEEYRAKARGNYRKADESFERCDTDGFLSQWALGVKASEYNALADLAEAGWVHDFPALHDEATGRRLDARLVDGKFSRVWLLADDEADLYGRRFIPMDGSHDPDFKQRSKVQRDLGLIQRYEQAPAYVKMSGGMTPFPIIFRTDGK